MGRKKIDMNCKVPKGKINSTFKKRKTGAAAKVKQLGKLCDVDVALIVFNPRNDNVLAVSYGGKIDEIINKFHDFKEQHLEKVEFQEQLRVQPYQLQHPNTQVLHLPPPTFQFPQMGIGMPEGQLQGFDIQAQGNNNSPNGQQQLPQNQFPLPTPRPSDFQHNNYSQ